MDDIAARQAKRQADLRKIVMKLRVTDSSGNRKDLEYSHFNAINLLEALVPTVKDKLQALDMETGRKSPNWNDTAFHFTDGTYDIANDHKKGNQDLYEFFVFRREERAGDRLDLKLLSGDADDDKLWAPSYSVLAAREERDERAAQAAARSTASAKKVTKMPPGGPIGLGPFYEGREQGQSGGRRRRRRTKRRGSKKRRTSKKRRSSKKRRRTRRR